MIKVNTPLILILLLGNKFFPSSLLQTFQLLFRKNWQHVYIFTCNIVKIARENNLSWCVIWSEIILPILCRELEFCGKCVIKKYTLCRLITN